MLSTTMHLRNRMLKIGDFSRLCQVGIKTLRHYDEIGLLRPASIDPLTNHRFYSLDQLPRIHRIVVLKELGLSLEQIARMIDADLSEEQLQGMLALKEAEVEQRLAEEMSRLARIRFHLSQLNREKHVSQQDIRIKRLAAFRALTLRFTAQHHLHFARVTAEIRSTLQAKSFAGNGHPIHITYAHEYHHDHVEAEFVVPANDAWTEDVPLPTFGTMTIREFPEIDAATYLHLGSPESVNEGLIDLHQWVASHGYTETGEIRLVYLKGLVVQRLPVDEWMFEVQHPLEKS
jgi:DNA-binding transcriptional MerR regulator